MLITTAVFIPFVIEGCYMRKSVKTFRDQRRTIRSFYMAPVLGISLTLLMPVLYFLIKVFTLPNMFSSANKSYIITVIISFLILFSVLCIMGFQAH